MITTSDAEPASPGYPTVWGLTPLELHDRFWAARGVQVVRQGEASELVEDAELFLLLDARLLVLFPVGRLVDDLTWLDPALVWVRIRDRRDRGYEEVVEVDHGQRFVGYRRSYGTRDSRLARVAVTPSPDVAHAWQAAGDPTGGWRAVRRCTTYQHRSTVSVVGKTYSVTSDREVMQFTRDLVEKWRQPDATVDRATPLRKEVWADTEARVSDAVRFVGPVWVGAGRTLPETACVVGPAVVWDDPEHRPRIDRVRWDELEPHQALQAPLRQPLNRPLIRIEKRLFDIAFALAALALVLPLFPLIMLAIYIEDGRPFFFAHIRETIGGRPFPCLKFRSMRRDAERIKAQLTAANQVDGPQFFMENDPRVTRVGRFLRKTQLDELPQFINVLLGHMSVVGPRPSPFKENQYCPAWREARLSLRPGITGLWQIMRSRREGEDFQEWIKYDLAYVEKVSFTLDLWIIWKTIVKALSLKGSD